MYKTEFGVIIVKDGKAWGKSSDGRHTEYGWVNLDCAEIYNPQFLKKPTDATYPNSPYSNELGMGKILKIKRIIVIRTIFLKDDECDDALSQIRNSSLN